MKEKLAEKLAQSHVMILTGSSRWWDTEPPLGVQSCVCGDERLFSLIGLVESLSLSKLWAPQTTNICHHFSFCPHQGLTAETTRSLKFYNLSFFSLSFLLLLEESITLPSFFWFLFVWRFGVFFKGLSMSSCINRITRLIPLNWRKMETA